MWISLLDVCVNLFIHSFLHWFLPSFIASFLHSLIPSFLHSLIPFFLHSLLPSFLPSFIDSFLHSLLPSFLHSLIPSFLHSLIPSFLHSVIPSFLHFFLSVIGLLVSKSNHQSSRHPFRPSELCSRSSTCLNHENQGWTSAMVKFPSRGWDVTGILKLPIWKGMMNETLQMYGKFEGFPFVKVHCVWVGNIMTPV